MADFAKTAGSGGGRLAKFGVGVAEAADQVVSRFVALVTELLFRHKPSAAIHDLALTDSVFQIVAGVAFRAAVSVEGVELEAGKFDGPTQAVHGVVEVFAALHAVVLVFRVVDAALDILLFALSGFRVPVFDTLFAQTGNVAGNQAVVDLGGTDSVHGSGVAFLAGRTFVLLVDGGGAAFAILLLAGARTSPVVVGGTSCTVGWVVSQLLAIFRFGNALAVQGLVVV